MTRAPRAAAWAVLAMLALAAPSLAAGGPEPATPDAREDRQDTGGHARHGDREHDHDHAHPHLGGHRLFGTPPADVPRWDDLPADRRARLEHLRERWESLPPARRIQALHRLDRHDRWRALAPGERERLREGARNFRALPPELKATMRESFAAMQRLPESEREALLERWRSLSPAQRRAWLEAGGPGIVPEPVAD